ncbi:hypothetical protein NECAME_17538 [Necator americanus]|uniref:Uncharacterized protein n=1 Tax=Necator americanus TaxID=51031 RepID=W2TNH8_NECAM|nr:hypothetical protein NECAME_17538 [Necator americanus]ETN83229.1 hypothetical protein NECAME_17538 [Necator americanus]
MDNIDEEYNRLVEHVHDCTKKTESFKTTKGRLSLETFVETWREIIAEIREEGTRIKDKQRTQDAIYKRLGVFRRKIREEHRRGHDYIKRINILGDDYDNSEMENLMRTSNVEEKDVRGDEKLMMAPIQLIRNAVKVGMMMTGKNVTDFDKKNVQLISPRFFPLTPNGNDTIHVISPSLFALHSEEQGIERETSLSNKMTLSGKNDNEAWLDLIIEASGVSDALYSMKKDMFTSYKNIRRDDPFYSLEGQPLWFSKENVTELFGEQEKVKVELFERLQRTFTKEQLNLMNITGYSIMTENQLNMVYGSQSPFYDPQMRKHFSNVSRNDVLVAVNSMIHGLATETMEFKAQRRKSIVLSPLVLGSITVDPATASQPVILSPVLLTPVVLSPAIFGAVILSPWVFVPVILAPRLLSPVILSPVMFSPIVLSPLAFDPLILCPGIGTPFILSPLVLSPFILSPVALNPLILSPFALTPFIGVPHTLSPLILSPFILSPIIYSPPFISAFVLSPHGLSPIIESNGKHFTSILSPSWLS